jgi:hypothetical protein
VALHYGNFAKYRHKIEIIISFIISYKNNMNEPNKQNAKPNIAKNSKTSKSEKIIISIKRHCGCGNDVWCCRSIDSNYCHII